MNKLILASGSPRRSQLLAEIGFEFEVKISNVDELHDASIPLRELCEHNAMLKAKDVAQHYSDHIVIGADTLVYKDGVPFGKPKSEAEARETLLSLSGISHSVCTGLCLVHGKKVERFSMVTEVQFKVIDAAVVSKYMSLVNVMDKAGSYAIQEHGEILVKEVIGSMSNVVGLPKELVKKKIESFL